MKVINGYSLTTELKNDKSGFAKWGFATKNGKEYFIKEFLSPIYPMDTAEISPAQIQRKRNICAQFELEKRKFYGELNKCLNGNVVTISDFFRCESRFYVITEKINAVSIAPEQVDRFILAQKVLIAKVILHSVAMLHKRHIVHGDIKADNILFKETPLQVYTAKLIDFDSSFFEDKPPAADGEFQGDMVYFAPESYAYIAEETGIPTRKIDIFALGILFHQYFCGSLPIFDRKNYTYAFEAILDGAGVSINPKIPPFVADVLRKMLAKNPEDRPEAEDLFNYFQYYCFNRNATVAEIDGSSAGMISTSRECEDVTSTVKKNPSDIIDSKTDKNENVNVVKTPGGLKIRMKTSGSSDGTNSPMSK